jgi:hypothetical protein
MVALAFGFSLVGLSGPTAQWAAANNQPSKPTLSTPFGTMTRHCLQAVVSAWLVYASAAVICKQNIYSA